MPQRQEVKFKVQYSTVNTPYNECHLEKANEQTKIQFYFHY